MLMLKSVVFPCNLGLQFMNIHSSSTIEVKIENKRKTCPDDIVKKTCFVRTKLKNQMVFSLLYKTTGELCM